MDPKASLFDDESDSSVLAGINVTPMADVMLVLLIIFMVTTPAIIAGFRVQLPQGHYLETRPEQERRTVLGIDRDGNYYLNKTPIVRDEALALLTAEFASHPRDKVLFLKADRSLAYREVREAIKLGREAGARAVAAVTEQLPPSRGAERR